MRHIAGNLRHELNKILNFIVAEANSIDPALRSDQIDLENPASRIVGATQLLDNFIEMICGVYEFSPNEAMFSTDQSSPILLRQTVIRLWNAYSLIKNSRRAPGLKCNIQISENIWIEKLPSTIEYLAAILIDNIWKYSFEKADIHISAQIQSDNLLSLSFVNHGKTLPHDFALFSKGSKADSASEGFGFGLYWAQVLADHYNRATGRLSEPLEIRHKQTPKQLTIDPTDQALSHFSEHKFEVINIAYSTR
jgi:signal transduction histidine kinase